jgi:hypothetical protein
MAAAVEAPASTTAEGPTSHTQIQGQASVYELMSRVMRDVRNVGKDGRNESQNYNFRGVDDAIGALAQPLRDHGVFMTPEVLDFKTEVRGRQNAVMMRVAFHFHGPAGDHVTAITLGEGSDFADKAANKAMSAALKYALIHTFMIPVDSKSLDEGDRDHPVGHHSAADGYMERLRKPAVWNNVTALQAMHTEAKADGLLQETVYAPGGEEMALGDLIVARGRTLKAEAAEREQRQAAEAPAVAAQVSAETGTGAPAAETSGEAGGESAEPGSPSEHLAKLLRQATDCWNSNNLLIFNQIGEDGAQHGVLDEEFTDRRGAVTTLRKVLDGRIAEIQAAQGGAGEASAA